jgi:hypothetical protein
MKRRTVLGTISGGIASSLLVGSGAFSSTRAERELNVEVVDDSQAYLRIDARSTGIAGRSSEVNLRDGGRVATFRIPGPEDDLVAGTDPSGVGLHSEYWFDDLAIIQNQGTDSITVYSQYNGDFSQIAIYDSTVNNTPLTSKSVGVELSPGDSFNMGLYIETADETPKQYRESLAIIGEV